MIVHLVDGTYELFRHFYGLRRFNKGKDRPYGAVVGVVQTVLQMLENNAVYLGVATDHVIESFRNRLWPDYKTSDGIEPALLAQFHPLEEALAAMGVVVWPMIELEADDSLASAAHLASEDEHLRKVAVCTPDKDLATLRTEAPLFKQVETLRWRGATPAFAAWADRMKAPRLLDRCEKAAAR